ncbi:RNA N6-adenosine-methyltransferase METTL16-like [Physeter macrocephalus]|uniref:RNA N6-adenosine-methyltransferase METTL16-like n=1 Tax=Physeter macrocephalus TaxID=9755 RepID=A0A455B2E1_PHYMC|nr:RNA N6-adenosine-methyltransferase METTL16-like [Physeter catodon]|eukprot:XP_028343085.1 RNA N6-adenosine-methyltransferase METTL16-like [Physeter catodon]
MKELSLKASSLGSETVEGIVVVTTWIEKILTDLKVQHKRVPCGKEEISLFLTAIENSWIHLRRKKRDRVRQLREVPRAPKNVIQALEEKRSPAKESGNSQDLAQGPRESALCGPALQEGESATVEGRGPNQDSLSQEENPEPMEDERTSSPSSAISVRFSRTLDPPPQAELSHTLQGEPGRFSSQLTLSSFVQERSFDNSPGVEEGLAARGVHVELLHAVLSCPPIGPRPGDIA